MKNRKSFPLNLNLQYFASESEGSEGAADSAETQGKESAEGTKEGTDNKKAEDIMIPKSRFDEVNDNYKSMKAELDRMKTEQSEAEKARQKQEKEDAKNRGEYESLYNETHTQLETVQSEKAAADERVQALESVITGLLDSKLEGIDKDYHDIIPEGMTPEQKLTWVNNAEQKGIFGNKQQSNEPLGKQTNPAESGTVDAGSLNPLQKMLSGYGK